MRKRSLGLAVLIGLSFSLVIQVATNTNVLGGFAFVPPPSTITVQMYRLTQGGGIVRNPSQTPEGCATPANRNKWGCTAFDEGKTILPTPTLTIIPVPYPYGSTPAPQVAFETDYLKNVVPQEMAGGSPQTALRAQAVAARSYAMYQMNFKKKIG